MDMKKEGRWTAWWCRHCEWWDKGRKVCRMIERECEFVTGNPVDLRELCGGRDFKEKE